MGPKKKRAGEYSEEDTHRPAHHDQRLQRPNFLGNEANSPASLEKETRKNLGRFHNWTPPCYHQITALYRFLFTRSEEFILRRMLAKARLLNRKCETTLFISVS